MATHSTLILAQLIVVFSMTHMNAEVLAEVNYNADEAARAVVEGELDGRLAWIRIQSGIEIADRDSLPHRLTIRWEYPDNGADGMPPEELQDRFRALEDALADALRADESGVLSLIITTSGAREWHVHFSESEAIQQSVNAAFAELPEMPISLSGKADPEWSEYSYFASAFSAE